MSIKTTEAKVDDLHVPIPLYRHAAPSAPWPWMDFKRDVAEVEFEVVLKGEREGGRAERAWCQYPQSLFGNWTQDQVKRSRMFEVMRSGGGSAGVEKVQGEGVVGEGTWERVREGERGCVVHYVDVLRGGTFRAEGKSGSEVVDVGDDTAQMAFWMRLGEPRDKGIRLRALFVERMSGPVLQILGMRYNVEPFFFSSSANWIPSKYQEDAQPSKGDHITVVVPFVRVIRNELVTDEGGVIDTQAPLHLSDHTVLLQDLLAIHMVRTTSSDTILSYHPDSALRRGSAARLRNLLRRTGESVYWSKLYKESNDPTIVLLTLLWHAVYAWDEALEVLYDYLNNTLEATELTIAHVSHTRELHKVRAHLIYYQQLLRDFRASVAFVKKTTNPAMDAASVTERERKTAAKILRLEADNLLGEIERLEKQREIQTDRLGNAMSLGFSTVKNEDTKVIHGLTTTTMRDAATIKQISYFTLVFLPPYFVASVFRMNVKEVNPNATQSLVHYIEGTVMFTLCTAWLVIALQESSSLHPGGRNVVRRLAWPAFYVFAMVRRAMGRRRAA